MILTVEFFPDSVLVSWAAARVFKGKTGLLIAIGCKVYCYNDPRGATGWSKKNLSPIAFVRDMRNLKHAGGSISVYVNELGRSGFLSDCNLVGDYPDFSEFYRITYGKPWVDIQTFKIPTRVWAGRHLVGW
jgi:hypothetical protein